VYGALFLVEPSQLPTIVIYRATRCLKNVHDKIPPAIVRLIWVPHAPVPREWPGYGDSKSSLLLESESSSLLLESDTCATPGRAAVSDEPTNHGRLSISETLGRRSGSNTRISWSSWINPGVSSTFDLDRILCSRGMLQVLATYDAPVYSVKNQEHFTRS